MNFVDVHYRISGGDIMFLIRSKRKVWIKLDRLDQFNKILTRVSRNKLGKKTIINPYDIQDTLDILNVLINMKFNKLCRIGEAFVFYKNRFQRDKLFFKDFYYLTTNESGYKILNNFLGSKVLSPSVSLQYNKLLYMLNFSVREDILHNPSSTLSISRKKIKAYLQMKIENDMPLVAKMLSSKLDYRKFEALA